MNSELVIAIDGYSSCGKSTLAKDLASILGYKYIDSGAMYRCVTLFLILNDIRVNDLDGIRLSLDQIKIDFCFDLGENKVFLNDKDVSQEIRSLEVSNLVSEVAAIPAVRTALVRIQEAMGTANGIVMDGRDIGTVVFPMADLKIFVTAAEDVRIDRRFHEMISSGLNVDRDAIRKNIRHRDHIDTTRKVSPLTKASDAIVLDNSNLTKKEQLDQVLKWVNDLA